MAFLCYALLVAAWIVDLCTPQLLVVAILFNGPIALSSPALRSRLTIQLVVAAEIANAVAGYVNGVQAGSRWDAIAIGDRLLLAASFVLVGYLAVETQKHAREAGESAGRMRQVRIERALREATERMRGTLNVELVQRAIVRESLELLGAAAAMLIVRDAAFEVPLLLRFARGDRDVAYERHPLSTELASLEARAKAAPGAVATISSDDALGRLTLGALSARRALVAVIRTRGTGDYVLVETETDDVRMESDAEPALHVFTEQAGIALEQATLFAQLGERNDEIARQKEELVRRGDVIRDIVYALAHDLRTPLAATQVTIDQAMAGAYGELPESYQEILRSTLSANEDERRIVETLLLVARYEAGEESSVRESFDARELAQRAVEELRPLADVKGVSVRADLEAQPATALGDPNEIRRAIVNLLANAVAATPEGGLVLVRVDRAAGSVTIEVADDGYGVPVERRPALFVRFGGSRAGAGTGLGLYIVRRIAEKHGGAVAYAPREPRGSLFTLSLPAQTA